MVDSFKVFCMKMFNELNNNVNNSFETLDSKVLEKSINEILIQEENFNEIDSLTDNVLNRIIYLEQSKKIIKDIENISIN